MTIINNIKKKIGGIPVILGLIPLLSFDAMAIFLKESNILKKGSSNTEVTWLAFQLSNSNYLIYDEVTKGKDGNLVYDSTMEEAVRHFQRDLGIEETGEYSSQLDEVLNVWTKEMTSVSLGMRELSAVIGTQGHDVDELVRLLKNAGFEPDKRRMEAQYVSVNRKPIIDKLIDAGIYEFNLNHDCGYYRYSSDIERAFKTFQAFHGLAPDGKLTKETVKKLYDYDKVGK